MRFHCGVGWDCVILIKFSGNFVLDIQKVIYQISKFYGGFLNFITDIDLSQCSLFLTFLIFV